MNGLRELRAANERAAERELQELRADTIRGLRYALRSGGMVEVNAIIGEALALPIAQVKAIIKAVLVHSGKDAA